MHETTFSQRENLKAAISILSPRDQEVLKMRFGVDGDPPLTLEQVGMYFNVSSERIRQIEARAVRRLQQTLQAVTDPREIP